MRSTPGRHAGMRRRSVLERVVERGELRFEVFFGVARNFKRFFHDVDAVVAHRAGGKLHAVAHDVVLVGENVLRLFVQQRVHTALRHGERVVREHDRAGFLVGLEHREIDDEAELEAVFVDEAEARAELRADLPGKLRGDVRLVGDEENDAAGFQTGAADQFVRAFRPEDIC